MGQETEGQLLQPFSSRAGAATQTAAPKLRLITAIRRKAVGKSIGPPWLSRLDGATGAGTNAGAGRATRRAGSPHVSLDHAAQV